jgi:ABC-type nitrate/sulfonate/bicarbonate transport system ATPase subunit
VAARAKIRAVVISSSASKLMTAVALQIYSDNDENITMSDEKVSMQKKKQKSNRDYSIFKHVRLCNIARKAIDQKTGGVRIRLCIERDINTTT